mmetsp:Transcript_233/g.469  ORF Transcript_233/g.469 Transcript_233/m.469 type:complete len:202 (-) Transcript_233:58-663(-)
MDESCQNDRELRQRVRGNSIALGVNVFCEEDIVVTVLFFWDIRTVQVRDGNTGNQTSDGVGNVRGMLQAVEGIAAIGQGNGRYVFLQLLNHLWRNLDGFVVDFLVGVGVKIWKLHDRNYLVCDCSFLDIVQNRLIVPPSGFSRSLAFGHDLLQKFDKNLHIPIDQSLDFFRRFAVQRINGTGSFSHFDDDVKLQIKVYVVL